MKRSAFLRLLLGGIIALGVSARTVQAQEPKIPAHGEIPPLRSG